MPTQTQTIAEARDLIAFAARFADGLHAAEQRLACSELDEERSWLSAAARRMTESSAEVEAALAGASALPELEGERHAKAQALLQAWVDALEGLAVGIGSHASPSHPLMEVLFPHQKFDKLRRGGSAARATLDEVERRRRKAYVVRLAGEPEYAFLPALLARFDEAKAALAEHEQPIDLSDDELAALREAVLAAADGLRARWEQARWLARAALADQPGWFEELGLDAKPRKRPARGGSTPPEAT